MRLGLIARADNTGLGIQTWEFYKHMKPDKTMVVDISDLNHNKNYPERYPDAQFINGFPTHGDIDFFLMDLDLVFIAEAAYSEYLYTSARAKGIKVANQYNYEFMDWLINPDYPRPDMLIAPSKWHYEDVEAWCQRNDVQHVYLHCPVNRDLIPFRQKEQARIFLHTAGRAAAHDRNGTADVILASRFLKTEAKIWIQFQGEQGLSHQATNTTADYERLLSEHGDHSKVTINQFEYDDYQTVYSDADVLILPRRYGGNCLPLNEALSAGMPAVMTDISPNNQFLPERWLVQSVRVNQFVPRTAVDIYGTDPEQIANKIDEFYNMTAEEMGQQSQTANELADSISWATMAPKYREVFEKLCNQ